MRHIRNTSHMTRGGASVNQAVPGWRSGLHLKFTHVARDAISRAEEVEPQPTLDAHAHTRGRFPARMQADTREAEAPEDMHSAFGTLPAVTLPLWFLTGL